MPYFCLSLLAGACTARWAVIGVTDGSIMKKNGLTTSMDKKGKKALN